MGAESIPATLVPLALFTMITVVSCSVLWLFYKSRQEHHQTVRKALELGQELDPELMRAFARSPASPEADLQGGLIASSLGVAFLLVAGVNLLTGGDHDGSRVASFIGILILGFGVGRLIAYKARSDKSAD